MTYRGYIKNGVAVLDGTVKLPEGTPVVVSACIKEHDTVRATCAINSDGYHVKAGMVGTVVSLYGRGEAFAVEFPDLPDGPAVMTVRENEVEPTGPGANESH